MNGYVPTNMDPLPVPGTPTTAVFTGNNIVVRWSQERTYWERRNRPPVLGERSMLQSM